MSRWVSDLISFIEKYIMCECFSRIQHFYYANNQSHLTQDEKDCCKNHFFMSSTQNYNFKQLQYFEILIISVSQNALLFSV